VARGSVSAKAQLSFLRRLAVVYAYPLRSIILAELHNREMSPTEFAQEFGGGSVSRVNRHFQRLVEYGWLKLVRTASGGGRRGAVEHYYRATELAAIDSETWRQLPYSIRAAFIWRSFAHVGERLREALAVGTFDARPDRRLDWKALSLDRPGWARVGAAVDDFFKAVLEEQSDARLRVERSGEKPLVATIFLAAFKSPPSDRNDAEPHPSGLELPRGPESPTNWMSRLSKVLAHEVCLKIVAELNSRPMSVKEFHAEFGGSLPSLYRRFTMLVETGWLREVEGRTGGGRRGAVERFYRATYDTGSLADVPDAIRETHGWRVVSTLSERVKDAIEVGTDDSWDGGHMAWFSPLLDEAGLKRVVAAVDGLFALALEEQRRAERRLAKSKEPAKPSTLALAAFESPPEPKVH
jgi:DNA-binding transcriptional ArsR family regulator